MLVSLVGQCLHAVGIEQRSINVKVTLIGQLNGLQPGLLSRRSFQALNFSESTRKLDLAVIVQGRTPEDAYTVL